MNLISLDKLLHLAMVATLILLLDVIFAGCASYRSRQTENMTTNGVKSVSTDVRIHTLWDAKSDLAKLRLNTTDKSQLLTIGGLNQESTSTNIVNLFEAVARGAAAGAGKVVAP